MRFGRPVSYIINAFFCIFIKVCSSWTQAMQILVAAAIDQADVNLVGQILQCINPKALCPVCGPDTAFLTFPARCRFSGFFICNGEEWHLFADAHGVHQRPGRYCGRLAGIRCQCKQRWPGWKACTKLCLLYYSINIIVLIFDVCLIMQHHRTPLHCAAAGRWRSIAVSLLAAGADLSAADLVSLLFAITTFNMGKFHLLYLCILRNFRGFHTIFWSVSYR